MNDLDRLRQEYQFRKDKSPGDKRYSKENPAYRFTIQQRRNSIQKLLHQTGVTNLQEKKVLEVGCGNGGVLQELIEMGVTPTNLFGIDILLDRLEGAVTYCPASGVCNADGQSLPFSDGQFELVLQFTAFSSILDEVIKTRMAREMLRVLDHRGVILWYDFWWNPTNRQTKGITPKEITRLFPGMTYNFKKITLAPPISRWLVPLSKGAAKLLERLEFFNSHYLVIIQNK